MNPLSTVPLAAKSSVADIRRRFDADVERFSQITTGQQATMDAPLVLELIAAAGASCLQPGDRVLDLGCGAGNLTLSLLGRVAPLDCTLVDLSASMLERAGERLSAGGAGKVEALQADMRELEFADQSFNVIVAGMALHHLRGDDEWRRMFTHLHAWLRPGGLLLVSDLVPSDDPKLDALLWRRYADYLESLRGPAYREHVFAYIAAEDTPRSLGFQLALCQSVGFAAFEVLHRTAVFAVYCGRK